MVKKAVSVLPDPVGEQRSRSHPSMIVGIASFCGRVKSGNFSLNQLRTGGHNLSINASVSIGLSRYVISGIFFSTNLSGLQAWYDTYDCFVASLGPAKAFFAPTKDGFCFRFFSVQKKGRLGRNGGHENFVKRFCWTRTNTRKTALSLIHI